MKTFCTAFLVLAQLATASAEVYKCPDVNGKHKFQDLPCTDGKRLTVKPITIEATRGYEPQSRSYPGAKASSDPMVGMGKNHLISLLGSPDSTTESEGYDGSKIESMTFMQHGKAVTVYLKNGYVFKSSTIERDWIRQTRNTTRNCPTDTEIQNAETSASSIILTDRERREKRYEIARMKACRRN